MVIVLIHWKIKRDQLTEFKKWWTGEQADIRARQGLIGEFLSKPLSLEELLKITPEDHHFFRVCDLAPACDDEPYVPFVNIGLWESWGEFYRQVGRNFNDDDEKKPFEQYRRTRTVLESQNWRVGEFKLPTDQL